MKFMACYYCCQSVKCQWHAILCTETNFYFYIFYNYFDFIFNETGNNIHSEPQSKRKRTFLDNYQRQNICEVLINSSSGRKINKGVVKRLSSSYQVSVDVIYAIWRQKIETGDVCHKKTKCGRKKKVIDIEKIREIPLHKRSSLRSLAEALECTTGQLMRLIKKGVLRRHSSALKPHMTDDNMKARLRFCLSMLEESSIPFEPKFKSMHNVIHIDEKWFYVTKKSQNYYLLADEDDPYRPCKNKNYLMKVMFIVAVARPRFDYAGHETWSGKIGVWPLVEKVPARRSSVNRPAGTLETKPIGSITREVSRMYLRDKILPAVKEKVPPELASETIYIQQDNAPCHVSVDDEEFQAAASEGGFDIRLINQPPNSPDLNVLDLGFFAAIQALQQKKVTRTVDELIQAVQTSFDEFSSVDSNKIFLTLQSCMIEIMKVKGSNKYKTPHMKKDVMLRQATLPTTLNCDQELVAEISELLQGME